MNGKGSTDGVANRIVATCRAVDPQAHLAFVGRGCDGSTIVRIAASPASSASQLQRQLAGAMPLARVRTSESVLDGTLQATVVVPSRREEWAFAVREVCGRTHFVVLRVVAMGLLLVGLGMLAVQPAAD